MSSPAATIIAALDAVLPDIPSIAVIHSSFSKLVPDPGFRPSDGVAAIDHLIRKGWTVALPAFTFSFCGGRPFDRRRSPSETGPLADWVLDALVAARRTTHPIYSFVVAGRHADALLSCSAETVFADGSIFALFEREDAIQVMLGCGWGFCTQFHRYEEKAQVPYRYDKVFAGTADLGAGPRDGEATMYVRDLALDPINDFSGVVDDLRAQGLVRGAALWRGEVEAAGTTALARVTAERIAADAFSCLRNGAAVATRFAQDRARAEHTPVRVAILGHSNLDLLRRDVEESLTAHIADRAIAVHTVPFGQLDREILTPGSALMRADADVAVFVDRIEDLAGGAIDETAEADLEARIDAYARTILAYRDRARGRIVVAHLAVLSPTALPEEDARSRVQALDARLGRHLADVAELTWIDIAGEAARAGAPAHDPRLWAIGRIPFSAGFGAVLARRITGKVLAATGRTARVLVLDLDNTLWGGVLGEDGLEGIRLGGDYPGNAFTAFQRAIKTLAGRGIALAVSSKNDTDLALDAMAQHPDMQIRPDDLATHQIGWRPKAAAIADICATLDLGLSSALFVDDNPVERAHVRAALPDVRVLDLPDDPANYVDALLGSPWLDVIEVTAEDANRARSYRTRARIEALRTDGTGDGGVIEDFYRQLGMTLHVRRLDAGNRMRAAQLCAKTNQFNTTTIRYTAGELQSLHDGGADVLVLGLSDTMSARENIGLLILRAHPDVAEAGLVDLYLLSCRVLGRGLETAVLDWALGHARATGWQALYGIVRETERNTPARRVFADAGFAVDDATGQWCRATGHGPTPPDWLAIDAQVRRSVTEQEGQRMEDHGTTGA